MTKSPAKKQLITVAIDVGGTHVKFMTDMNREKRGLDSGPKMTPTEMVKKVGRLARDWPYETVSTWFYPGPITRRWEHALPH